MLGPEKNHGLYVIKSLQLSLSLELSLIYYDHLTIVI